MLSFFPQLSPAADGAPPEPSRYVWLDLVDPDESERAFVEDATGLSLPTREALSEIESSSRHYLHEGALYLSTPIISRAREEQPVLAPVGFILTPERLVTVRFAPLNAFDTAAAQLAHAPALTSLEAFTRLLEALVDRIADVLEMVGGDLDQVSSRAFNVDHRVGEAPGRKNRALQATLRALGRTGDRLSKIRDSLLGLDRMLQFVLELKRDGYPDDIRIRMRAVSQDLVSLKDYQGRLEGKVQFLLDAVLGFINIEQNDIIKVLTVVSVVGVPPTLVASIYGMNFKIMPELGWAFGYPYALGLIVLTTIIPLVWFRVRGWL